MGNSRFRLSDMMPNAWFYKLRDMSRSRKRNGSQGMKKNKVTSPTTSTSKGHSQDTNFFSIEPHRAGKLCNSPIYSKHKDIPFSDSPRRSSKRRSRRKTIYMPSPIVVSSIESSSESNLHEYASSDSESDKFSVPEFPNVLASDCSCRVSSSTNDIIIDMKNEPFIDGFDTISQLGLAPIFTKPVKFNDGYKVIEATEFIRSTKLDELKTHQLKEKSSRVTKRERKTSPIARVSSSANSTGIRLRVNSPKLASRKVQGYARRSVSSSGSKISSLNTDFPEGFAVVKSSFDPQRDFRESMVEMIMENNIRESKDLENLLACYLSLNSSEYHDLIVKAFEQIWYDMAQLKM